MSSGRIYPPLAESGRRLSTKSGCSHYWFWRSVCRGAECPFV